MASYNEIQYFIEVANSLNLSRASERLGISQPTLSTAIKRLEFSIGIDLLVRHKNGVTLTQAGKQLLAHSKQLLQYWDAVKSRALASHHEIQGTFSLGCHPSVALHHLPRFLPELLAANPKLEIQLKHDISRKIAEGVIDLSIDVGIVVNPIKHPDLIIQLLKEDEVTFWKSSIIQNNNNDLSSNAAIIICDPELMQTEWLLKKLQQQGVSYSRLLTSSSLELSAQLALKGGGISILPKSVVMTHESLIPLENMPIYKDEIALIYRHENRAIKGLQEICKTIKSIFS